MNGSRSFLIRDLLGDVLSSAARLKKREEGDEEDKILEDGADSHVVGDNSG